MSAMKSHTVQLMILMHLLAAAAVNATLCYLRLQIQRRRLHQEGCGQSGSQFREGGAAMFKGRVHDSYRQLQH
jgi:hypothetical protein